MQRLVEEKKGNTSHRLKILLTATQLNGPAFQAANGLQTVYDGLHTRHGARWGVGAYDAANQTFTLVVSFSAAPTPPARPLTGSNLAYEIVHSVVTPGFAALPDAKITASFQLAAAVTELHGTAGVTAFGNITLAEVQQIANNAGRGHVLSNRDRERADYLAMVDGQDRAGAVPVAERILVDEQMQVDVAGRVGVQTYIERRRHAENQLRARDMTLESMCVDLGRGAVPYVQGAADSLTDPQFLAPRPREGPGGREAAAGKLRLGEDGGSFGLARTGEASAWRGREDVRGAWPAGPCSCNKKHGVLLSGGLAALRPRRQGGARDRPA
jgi:hypothetical protein